MDDKDDDVDDYDDDDDGDDNDNLKKSAALSRSRRWKVASG